MALRNYSAEVEIDHKEKTLQLKVIPRDALVENAVSNTKSLSGGERSYSSKHKKVREPVSRLNLF